MDEAKTLYLDEFCSMVLGQSFRPPMSTEFTDLIEDKLAHGTRKYGENSWEKHDMIREMQAELVDTFNYAYLEFRVLRALSLETINSMIFQRAAALLRKIALDAFNGWVSITKLAAQLDALGLQRSVSGDDRVGPGVIDALRRAEIRAGGEGMDGTEGTGDATEGDAAADGGGDREVPRESADTPSGDEPARPASRRRRAHAAPETV